MLGASNDASKRHDHPQEGIDLGLDGDAGLDQLVAGEECIERLHDIRVVRVGRLQRLSKSGQGGVRGLMIYANIAQILTTMERTRVSMEPNAA